MQETPASISGPASSLEQLRQLTETAVFKDDRPTRVWRVDDRDGRPWVIKRFNHPAWRQRGLAAVGQHPVQRETAWHRRLIEAGLAVSPAFDLGFDDRGRRYQATPYLGVTLYDLIRRTPALPATQRHDLARQAGRLTGQLVAMGVFYRDLKSSNLVVDAAGTLRLIDAGDCRPTRLVSRRGTARKMVDRLHRHLRRAGPGYSFAAVHRTDRVRFIQAMAETWDATPPPPWWADLEPDAGA